MQPGKKAEGQVVVRPVGLGRLPQEERGPLERCPRPWPQARYIARHCSRIPNRQQT